MNAAFAVELIDFESPDGKYHGFNGAANVPAALAGVIEAVNGLDNRPIPSRRLSADPSPIGFLTPPQVSRLYNFPPGTGAGQTIGTYQDQGYGYTLYDVNTTLSNWNVTQTGTLTAFPAGSNSGVSDIETIIDITVAAAMAPAANIVAYFCQGATAADILSTLQSMIHPTGSDPVPTIIFFCYAWAADDETNFISANQYTQQFSNLFQDAANLLITVLTGSADTGAYLDDPTQAQTVYPGTDPYILCCGGTTIGDIQGSNFEEWVWNDITSFLIPQSGNNPPVHAPGATGGGVSTRFPVPPYPVAVRD
jgi:kumamolisin